MAAPLLDSVAISSMLIASLFDKGDVAVPGLGGSDHADVDRRRNCAGSRNG